MKKSIITLALLIVATFLVQAKDKEWQNLFNGKNLDGWKVLNGTAPYTIEGDEIVGTTKKNTPNTFLATEKAYTNFVLEYDMKMDEGLNSGVQIRSLSIPELRNGRVHGLQIECEDSKRGWAGGVFSEASKGWRYPLEYNPAAKTAFKKGEWNHFKVVCYNNHIMTWLNGISCANLVEEEIETGFIALQVHGIDSKKEDYSNKQIR